MTVAAFYAQMKYDSDSVNIPGSLLLNIGSGDPIARIRR